MTQFVHITMTQKDVCKFIAQFIESQDDDLRELRYAALASLNTKTAHKSDDDGDDLDALREAALKSRSYSTKNEENHIFEKLQPPKSSNLINLTPDPCSENHPQAPNRKHSRSHSESSSRSDVDSGSRSEHSSLESSRTSSEEESSNESGADSESESSQHRENDQESKSKPTAGATFEKHKSLNEDDDILNAIDQFLDEDSLETETNQAANPVQLEKPVKTDQSKKEKTSKTKARVKKPKKVRNKNDSTKKSFDKVEAEKDLRVAKSPTDSAKAVEDNPPAPKASIRRAEANVAREQIGARQASLGDEGTRRADDLDSVHSSDLSFLDDSSDEETCVKNTKQKTLRNGESALKKRDRIATGKGRRLNGLQTQPHRKNADGSGEISAKEQSKPENRRKPPDLRKKLEVRGLYRKRQLARNGEAEKPAQADMDSNNNSVRRHAGDKRVSKIYVKPSLIAQANAPDNSASAKVPRAEETENIVITRNVSDRGFVKKSIRLREIQKPNDEKLEPTPVNRKRSVLHFAPDTPVAEKREKIEKLMKKAPSLEKRNDKVLDEKEDRTFSDISDNDFDDFEIAEDFDTEVPLQSRADQENEDAEKDRFHQQSDTRKFIPRRKKTDLRGESPSEKTRSQKSAVANSRRPVRQRLGLPRDVDCFDRREETRHRAHREEESQRRARNARLPPPTRNVRSRQSADNDDDLDLSAPLNFTDTVNRSAPRDAPPANESRAKRKRKVGLAVRRRREKSPVALKNIRHGSGSRRVRERLGRPDSPEDRRRSRREEGEDSPAHLRDREKEVDAKIRRIHEQNEAILKRRKEVELEEKRFKLG